MALAETNQRIQALRTQLDALRPLNPEQERRIMDKFRLDWNYHSNNLEGNSLTYGETKALLLFNITAQGKPLKDHLEIKGHNEAILWIEEVIRQERPLTESFIRELHKLLLKEPYQVDAITPDGQPTKRWIQVGQYKSAPNHVQTVTGEIFRFASVQETPALMNDLIEWYRSEMDDPTHNGWVLAATFHYKFIRIHPFDDGNGRLARILMNFILMQYGFPPIVIKTGEKSDYFRVLRQADIGDLEAFVVYIGEQLAYSLDLMLRGAKGEEIEEEDDLNKKITLLKAKLNKENQATTRKSSESIRELFKNSLKPLFQSLEQQLSKFDELFFDKEVSYQINNDSIEKYKRNPLLELEREIFYEPDYSKPVTKRSGSILTMNTPPRPKKNFSLLAFLYQLKGFKKTGTNTFNCSVECKIILEEFKYIITSPYVDALRIEKLYHQHITKEEIKFITFHFGEIVLNSIEQHINK